MKYLNRFIRYLFPKFQPIDKYKKEISALSKIKMNQQKIILSLEDKSKRYLEQLRLDAKFKNTIKLKNFSLYKEIVLELEKETHPKEEENIKALQKFIDETATATGYAKIYLRKLAIRNFKKIIEKRKRNEIEKLSQKDV
jgi:hypothetical protein